MAKPDSGAKRGKKSGMPGTAGGGSNAAAGRIRYSPSHSLEEPMDTNAGLDGIRQLFNPTTAQAPAQAGGSQTASNVQGEDASRRGSVTADPRGAATDTTAPPPASDPRGEVGGGESNAQSDPRGASASKEEEEEDVIARARDYIAKQKEKFVDDIKQKLGKEMLAYNSIRAHNSSVTTPINGGINCGGTGGDEQALEGMVGMGERWLLASSLKFDMKSKRIVSYSFRDDWTCLHCGIHGTKPAFKKRGEAGTGCGEQAVVLADQCYPPILQTGGHEKCLKIV
jgi:hypothetical protein